MRVKIIDACINGRWISMWRNKEVDLYCHDGKRNYWSIENVERVEGSCFFSGNVYIEYELIPKLRDGGQKENTDHNMFGDKRQRGKQRIRRT